jgi:hypothetical protein
VGPGAETTELADETSICVEVADNVLNDPELALDFERGMYEVAIPLRVGVVKTNNK